MPSGTYGGVRGRKTKVGRKLLRFPPTRLYPYPLPCCCPLFLALILRLIVLAERQPTTFGRIYDYSVLSIFLFFHVFINIDTVLSLTPVIGIPLPFFSYGSSSL